MIKNMFSTLRKAVSATPYLVCLISLAPPCALHAAALSPMSETGTGYESKAIVTWDVDDMVALAEAASLKRRNVSAPENIKKIIREEALDGPKVVELLLEGSFYTFWKDRGVKFGPRRCMLQLIKEKVAPEFLAQIEANGAAAQLQAKMQAREQFQAAAAAQLQVQLEAMRKIDHRECWERVSGESEWKVVHRKKDNQEVPLYLSDPQAEHSIPSILKMDSGSFFSTCLDYPPFLAQAGFTKKSNRRGDRWSSCWGDGNAFSHNRDALGFFRYLGSYYMHAHPSQGVVPFFLDLPSDIHLYPYHDPTFQTKFVYTFHYVNLDDNELQLFIRENNDLLGHPIPGLPILEQHMKFDSRGITLLSYNMPTIVVGERPVPDEMEDFIIRQEVLSVLSAAKVAVEQGISFLVVTNFPKGVEEKDRASLFLRYLKPHADKLYNEHQLVFILPIEEEGEPFEAVMEHMAIACSPLEYQPNHWMERSHKLFIDSPYFSLPSGRTLFRGEERDLESLRETFPQLARGYIAHVDARIEDFYADQNRDRFFKEFGFVVPSYNGGSMETLYSAAGCALYRSLTQAAVERSTVKDIFINVDPTINLTHAHHYNLRNREIPPTNGYFTSTVFTHHPFIFVREGDPTPLPTPLTSFCSIALHPRRAVDPVYEESVSQLLISTPLCNLDKGFGVLQKLVPEEFSRPGIIEANRKHILGQYMNALAIASNQGKQGIVIIPQYTSLWYECSRAELLEVITSPSLRSAVEEKGMVLLILDPRIDSQSNLFDSLDSADQATQPCLNDLAELDQLLLAREGTTAMCTMC